MNTLKKAKAKLERERKREREREEMRRNKDVETRPSETLRDKKKIRGREKYPFVIGHFGYSDHSHSGYFIKYSFLF